MSSQTYSRSFLQGLPEEEKQRRIDSIVNGFILNLRNSAVAGKTQYIYTPDLHNMSTPDLHNMSGPIVLTRKTYTPPTPTITNEDLIAAFQRKFPDCDVSYKETWVEVDAVNKVLKKGIVIDWS